VDWIKCIRNRLLRAARREAGITLIETVLAIAIFGIVSTSVIGVLTSATAADGNARQRSIALELAQQQVEYIRQLNYKDVGVSGGNPGGIVQGTQSKWVAGLRYDLTTRVEFVNDPISGGVVENANYKQIRVIVARHSDSMELARFSTYLSDSARLSSGSLNNSLINVTAMDYWTNELLGGAEVALTKTWDAGFTASDTTGAITGLPTFGIATFEGLQETPLSPVGYYDVTASLDGYTTLKEDLPPELATATESAAHVTLDTSGTKSTIIHLYKPCHINVRIVNETDGSTYTAGQATVTISSTTRSATTEQFVTTDGTVSTDTINGEKVLPGTYTVDVDTPTNRHGESANNPVPTGATDYANGNLISNIEVSLPAYIPPIYITLTVRVRQGANGCSSPLGNLMKNATVKVVWLSNPSDPTHNFTASTGSWTYSDAVFTGVPADSYEIRVTVPYKPPWGNWQTLQGTIPETAYSSDTSVCVGVS
jgi:type II secretory pathway pseudopilin PulG